MIVSYSENGLDTKFLGILEAFWKVDVGLKFNLIIKIGNHFIQLFRLYTIQF